MSETPPKTPLALDPGPRPRRSAPVSCFGCLLAVLALLGALVVALLFLALGIQGMETLDRFQPPHASLYQNETWAKVQNRSAVVRPLITHKEQFDILATVWLRANASEQFRHRAGKPAAARSDLAAAEGDQEDPKKGHIWRELSMIGEMQLWADEGPRPSKEDDDIVEIPLFSDIILSGARLSDKGLTATVPLEFPTDVFLEQNISADHLRASFVLVPSEHTFQHLRSFSSWMPQYVLDTLLPAKPSFSNDPTLQEQAANLLTISVPLVDFHATENLCHAAVDAAGGSEISRSRHRWSSPSWRHPHIVTRTHLRVLDETQLYNLTAYDDFHNQLQNTSCGQAYQTFGQDKRGVPHRSVCARTYAKVGSMETKFEFGIPSDNGDIETQWAYSPFLSVAPHSSGPMDLIPVPVNRENCSADISYLLKELPPMEPAKLNDTMKINWQISFSGRSPRKMLLSDYLSWAPVMNESYSELEKVMAQENFEWQNSLRGHRFGDKSHPRRRIFAYSVDAGSQMMLFVLEVAYWWRLSSTVGLSLRAQYVTILSSVLTGLHELLRYKLHDGSMEDVVIALVFGGLECFLKVRAISRLGLRWRGFLAFPFVSAPATHLERASARIDAKSSWSSIGAMSMLLTAFCWLAGFRDLIAALRPKGPQDDWDFPFPLLPLWSLVFALDAVARVLQIVMNHRSRSFAGQFKISAYLLLLATCAKLAMFVPSILGHLPARDGLSVQNGVVSLFTFILAWQAYILPTAKGDSEDEHEK